MILHKNWFRGKKYERLQKIGGWTTSELPFSPAFLFDPPEIRFVWGFSLPGLDPWVNMMQRKTSWKPQDEFIPMVTQNLMVCWCCFACFEIENIFKKICCCLETRWKMPIHNGINWWATPGNLYPLKRTIDWVHSPPRMVTARIYYIFVMESLDTFYLPLLGILGGGMDPKYTPQRLTIYTPWK